MHPALRKGPLFNETHTPILHSFTKNNPPFSAFLQKAPSPISFPAHGLPVRRSFFVLSARARVVRTTTGLQRPAVDARLACSPGLPDNTEKISDGWTGKGEGDFRPALDVGEDGAAG